MRNKKGREEGRGVREGENKRWGTREDGIMKERREGERINERG